MPLTYKECKLLLELLKDKYGPGYSDDALVGHLQAKLSILLEVAYRREQGESLRPEEP